MRDFLPVGLAPVPAFFLPAPRRYPVAARDTQHVVTLDEPTLRVAEIAFEALGEEIFG